MLAYAITTFNEARNISPCINSLKKAGVNDHNIYVIDSISSDGTQKIAKSSGATVFENPFLDMASQRNFAFSKIAKNDLEIQFVCILDADERISTEFHTELQSVVADLQNCSKSVSISVCRKMMFNGYWVKRSSNFPVFIDRIGSIRTTTWRNAGHGEVLESDLRLRVESPLSEEDEKGIESLLTRHTVYARNEAKRPIKGGKQSRLKERLLSLRGSHFFVLFYAIYLFLARGVLFRDQRERDYALIKILYEIQIVLFKRYD